MASATAHSGAALGRGMTRYGVFGANNEDSIYNTMDTGSPELYAISGID